MESRLEHDAEADLHAPSGDQGHTAAQVDRLLRARARARARG